MTPLTEEDRHNFVRDGVLIRRNAVPAHLVDRARDLILDWYGGTGPDAAELGDYTQRTFAPELGTHPDLLAVLHDSDLGEYAGTLIGAETLPVNTVQTQIRVPSRQLPAQQPVKDMHVDGVACPHLDPSELRTFTLLVGVFLTEVPDVAAGALRYQPGGHYRMAGWFREEWHLGMTAQVPPDVDAREGVPLLGRPGDAAFVHHLVPHAVGPNHRTSPRIMLYFRIHHVRHGEQAMQALGNPWLEFPGLRPAASSR